MSKFEGFQGGREQYLEFSRNKNEDDLGLENIEGQNEKLEEENDELQNQIGSTEQSILRSPEGRKILNSYLLTTPLGTLYEAVKATREDPESQRSLLEAVAEIERSRLESDYNVEIVEPGEIASDMIYSVSSVLKHEVYMSDPEAKVIVDEAIQKLEHLGRMSPSDVRTVSRVFKAIPREHLAASIKTIEKTPVREVLSILQGLSKNLANVTDREMADRVDSLRRELQETEGNTAAYIRPWNKEVVFSQRVSSLFAWTLAHEVGHGVYSNILKREQVQEWENISKKALTLYGEHAGEEHQASENFSETYALYLLNKPLFKILGIFDEEFQKQYEYFKSIMPEGTSNMPKAAGVYYPLMDKGSRWLLGAIEKFTKLPFFEARKQALKYTYDKKKSEDAAAQIGASVDERLKKLYGRLREAFFGKVNLDFIQREEDTRACQERWKEFMKRDITELHQNRKIVRLLIENNVLSRAYEASKTVHIRGKSLRQLTASSIIMSAYELAALSEGDEEFFENARQATAIFLEDHIRIIGNNGERRFGYKPEYQAEIDDLLAENDLEKVVPMTYEVQMDGLRALKQPSESDVWETQRLQEQYGIGFINTDERGFSEIALKRIEEAISELPMADLRLMAGFMRVSESTPGNVLKSLLKQMARGEKKWIPINDLTLVMPKNETQNFIAAHVAQEVLRTNRELAKEFIEIGGWQEAKPPLHARVLAKFFSESNPYVHFCWNDSAPDSFLNHFSRGHMQLDFQTCYQWYLLYRQEFQELAAQNPVLQAKFELFEKHFGKSE
jgi:hypothetical protein